MSFWNHKEVHDSMSHSLMQNEVSTHADYAQKHFRDFQGQITALQRAIGSPNADHFEIHLQVEAITTAGKAGKDMIKTIEKLPVKGRIQNENKTRILTKLNKELETLLHRFQQLVVKIQEIDKKEIEEVKKSFVNDPQYEQYVKSAKSSFAVSSAKGSFSSVHSSDFEQLVMNESFLIERQDDLSKLQGCMIDVRDMMADCAVLVQEQGDELDRIEDDVSRTEIHVEKATKELESADNYQRNTQRKMGMLLLTILMIVAVVCLCVFVGMQFINK